jgi:symplekin
MQAYMERLAQARQAFFEESNKKRAAAAEPEREQNSAKRQRMDINADLQRFANPSRPVSVAELFTLTDDPGAANFDVTSIPHDTVSRMLVPLLRTVGKAELDVSVAIVRSRLAAISQAQRMAAATAAAAQVDEDEDYEPDYQPVEDAEQIKNRMELEDPEDVGIGIPKPSVALPPFQLPRPQQMSYEDAEILYIDSMNQILHRINEVPESTNKAQKGFIRVAGGDMDKKAMVLIYIRLITRPFVGLHIGDEGAAKDPKKSKIPPDAILVSPRIRAVADMSRQKLLTYIMSDWTRRLDIAVNWLTEEWYNDAIAAKAFDEGKGMFYDQPPKQNFGVWAHRLLDELSAFMGSEHTKLLIRFVSEVPGLDSGLIEKVKRLAIDPERISMVVAALQYVLI